MSIVEQSVLVVDNSQERANELLRSLQPEFEFSSTDYTVSLRKAVLSHSEEEFQVCFVSAAFPQEDLASFIKDMQMMKKDLTCLFVQVQDAVAEEFDRKSLQSQGFATVISRKGTHKDKEAFEDAYKNRFHAQEVKRRKLNVEELMEMLLKEIDRTASDLRRGVDSKLVAIPMDGIEMDTSFDSEVMEGYFKILEKQTESAAPRQFEKLNIPDEVLTRLLPGLTKDGYKGKSHRVWELLCQKYGVKIGDAPTSPLDPPDTTTKEPSEGDNSDPTKRSS